MWKFLKAYFMPQYVSEIDQFLQDFTKTHPQLSASQRREREKYQAIYKARDKNPQDPSQG